MKKSVLFFCTSFASGGVEKVLINLANYFCSSGFSTSFLVSQRIGILGSQLDKRIETYSLDRRLFKSFWKTRLFFCLHNPDIIICGPQFINILTVVLVKLVLKKKSKVIITHHSFYDLDVKGMPFIHLFYKALLRTFYLHSDQIVAVSNAVKAHLVDDVGIPKEKIEVIYNPVIEKDFELLLKEEFTHKWFVRDRDYKILVCVGRLSAVKNQEGLINLLPGLIKKNNCRVLFIGDGEKKFDLQKMVSELKLEKYVDFIGSVTNPLKYIYNSDLLLLPSITETFSLVAIEAIACGTPVLSTPTLGVREVLKDCSGCFFEDISNPNGFISKISEILEIKKDDIDRNYTDKFRVNLIGKSYEKLVFDVCQKSC